MCTLSRCLVHAMPPQLTKIEHLSRDASAILRERYLAGTFSVVTQWVLDNLFIYIIYVHSHIYEWSSQWGLYSVWWWLIWNEYSMPSHYLNKFQGTSRKVLLRLLLIMPQQLWWWTQVNIWCLHDINIHTFAFDQDSSISNGMNHTFPLNSFIHIT